MGCQICILRVQRHFLRNFFHRITLNVTVSQKIQLVLLKLLSTLPGNFWAKQFSKSSFWSFFLVLPRFYKHGLPKLYPTCPEENFADFFFTESYYLALWAKKFSWFSQNGILLFRGTFEQNNSQSRRFGFFCSPCQILQARVAKTVFYVSRSTFCGFFSQNHINWHCEWRNSAGFVKTAF